MRGLGSGYSVSLLERAFGLREKVFGGLVNALLGVLVFLMGLLSPYFLDWGLRVWLLYFPISDAIVERNLAIHAEIVNR